MDRPRFRPSNRLPALGLAILLLTVLAAPVHATERAPYSLEVLVDGISLDKLHSRGTTYVEARENREYSIRLTNHTGQRIAVALSVDGLNTIDAKVTSARDASKWILGPFETITLDGWQTSSDTARRFFFTTEEKSYGAWLGKTSNLGTIAAAVFRERQVRPQRPPRPIEQKRGDRSGGRLAPQSESAPSKAAADAEGEVQELSDDLAATGIGRELDHQVQRVRFRAEKNPVTTLQLRYEYRDALVSLGVLPRHKRHTSPLSRRERARGFIDQGFAPDPFAAPHRR